MSSLRQESVVVAVRPTAINIFKFYFWVLKNILKVEQYGRPTLSYISYSLTAELMVEIHRFGRCITQIRTYKPIHGADVVIVIIISTDLSTTLNLHTYSSL